MIEYSSNTRIDMKISIALCTYNGSKYLREQLDSLFNQSVKPNEIVVSDDVSTDETIEILREYINLDPDIQLIIIENDTRRGVFKNFPFVISKCKGDIIFACDQDDYWYPNKIERHMQIHESDNNIDFVFSNAEVVNNDISQFLYPLWEVKSILDIKNGQASFRSLVIKGRSIAGCCTSFKKNFVEKIYPFPDGIYHDDWIATNACLVGKIYGIGNSLIKYRQHGSNAVGIVRGGKISFYKSLFTNVPFYVRSDMYIYARHQKIYAALSKSIYTEKLVQSYNLDTNLEFYKIRSQYGNETFMYNLKQLTVCLIKHRYKYHYGIFTYLKDVYNLSFIRVFKIKLNDKY